MARPRNNETDAPTPPSTLDPTLFAESDREIDKGHGTEALGPSDTSDSGSDVQGGPGLFHEVGAGLGLGTGTTSDPDDGSAGYTAGPDVGDANLDSDSDAEGTGERAAAARDATVPDGRDIDTDHIEFIGEIDNDSGDEDKAPTLSRKKYRR